MPSPDDIAHQQNLLAIHRRNLRHYLGQQAQLGPAQTPIGTLNGIEEERANIKRIKGILSGWGQTVESDPDDEPPAPPNPAPAKPAQPDGATKPAAQRPARNKGQHAYDVFISYSSRDREWVRGWLLPRLESAGLRVSIDYRDFELGLPILVNIERAVERSRHVLLVLTPNWIQSQWTDFESLLTSTADPAGRRRKLIPLMLQACELPARISMLSYADFTQPAEHEWQLDRLVQSLLQARDSNPRSKSSKRPRETAPAAPTSPEQPTTQAGRDQIDARESQGYIGQAAGVSQNFGEQHTTNAGPVIQIYGGDFRGSNLPIGNSVGRDLNQSGGATASAFDQRGWNVQGSVYNIAGDLNIGANPSKDEFAAALRQLRDELAKAKDLPPDEASDLKDDLDDAIEALERPQPNKERTIKKLTAMREIVDGLKDNVGSKLALGKLIEQALAVLGGSNGE